MDFTILRRNTNLSIDDCVPVFEVNRRTVDNWEREKSKPPRAFFLYLSITTGELSFLDKAWKGFKILPDCILSPEGEHIWAYEVRALKYVYVAAGLERYKICRALIQTETLQKKGFEKRCFFRFNPAGAFEISYQQAIENTLACWAARVFNNLLITNHIIYL
jgi:hypothetical protein